MHLPNLLISFADLAGFLGFAYINTNFWVMRRDPDWHGFPAITRCPVCCERIYVWQRRERRTWKSTVAQGAFLMVTASFSALIHKKCKGDPEFMPTIEVHILN